MSAARVRAGARRRGRGGAHATLGRGLWRAVSLLALVIVSLVSVSELQAWSQVQRVERMEVDTTRGGEIRINFDLTFPGCVGAGEGMGAGCARRRRRARGRGGEGLRGRGGRRGAVCTGGGGRGRVPCALLSVDTEDVTQIPHKGVMHDVFKKRLSAEGRALGIVHRGTLGGTLTDVSDLEEGETAEKERAIREGRGSKNVAEAKRTGGECGSCYGAGAPGQCCSTCDEVRELYSKKKWNFDASQVEQCKKEGFGKAVTDSTANEGCNVYGHVMVPRVSGNIHFAPAQDFSKAGTFDNPEALDALTFTMQRFNASHAIKEFSFGPYVPGRVGPLRGTRRMFLPEDARDKGREGHPGQDHLGAMYQYYLKVVPTVYEMDAAPEPIASYQYSATTHMRKLHPTTQRGVPGVFFYYDFSPISVTIAEERLPFGRFLVELAAVVGGVFAIARFLDAWIHSCLQRSQP
jgi:hypothetical protein